MPLSSKDHWLLEFKKAVLGLLPEARAGRFLDAVALQQWTEHQAEEPEQAAERWVANRPKPARTKR